LPSDRLLHQVRVQLSSPHAARTGVAGAMFNVLEPVGAPATARLAICTVVSAMPGALKVAFWARTPERHPAPRLAVDFLDASDGWRYLGLADDFRLSTTWQRFEVSIHLGASRVGHKIEVALQLSRAAENPNCPLIAS